MLAYNKIIYSFLEGKKKTTLNDVIDVPCSFTPTAADIRASVMGTIVPVPRLIIITETIAGLGSNTDNCFNSRNVFKFKFHLYIFK